MAAAATISTVFTIRLTNDGAVAFTASNPRRGNFRVIGVEVFATSNTTSVQVGKNTVGTLISSAASVANTWKSFAVTNANAVFSATDVIFCDPQATTVTEILLTCIVAPAAALTIP